jgi:hypothetical protein
LTALLLPDAQPALADTPQDRTIYINSNAYGKAGTCVMGSDSYSGGAADTCTLGAALALANGESTASDPVRVTLATEFAAAKSFQTITIPTSGSTDGMMTTSAVNKLSTTGAHYLISAAMEVDLQNKLYISHLGATLQTTLWVNAKNVNLFNFSQVQGGQTAIGISGESEWVNIKGGTTLTDSGVVTRNFLLISNGAENISFSDYKVGNLSNGKDENCESAAVCLTSNGSVKSITRKVSISNVTFTTSHNPASATFTNCSSAKSSDCVNNSIVLNDNANVEGLDVGGNHFTNLKKADATDPVVFSGVQYNTVKLSNLDFHDNEIRNSGSCTTATYDYCTLFYLPYNTTMGGKNYIRRNSFVNDTSVVRDQPHAITAYMGRISGDKTISSNTYILNNHFDGFKAPAIWLNATGILTVSSNTFGPNTVSNSDTEQEGKAAGGGSGAAMFMNNGPYANQKAEPWQPASASISTLASGVCELRMVMNISTAGPTAPVLFDGYWTSTTKAEKYLGSTTTAVSAAGSIVFKVPQELLDAYGKLLDGKVRTQTQGNAYAQLQSSQYSKAIPVSGTCSPTKITLMSDDRGPVEGGTELIFTGSHIDSSLRVAVDGKPCNSLTVQSTTAARCFTPPSTRSPSRTGRVTVVVTVGSRTVATFPELFSYVAKGDLRIKKRAWKVDHAELKGLTPADMYRKIIDGNVAAVEIPHGASLGRGTRVAWTYETSYVYLVNGKPYGVETDDGVKDAVITDDKLEPICSITRMGLNTPVGCAALGIVF